MAVEWVGVDHPEVDHPAVVHPAEDLHPVEDPAEAKEVKVKKKKRKKKEKVAVVDSEDGPADGDSDGEVPAEDLDLEDLVDSVDSVDVEMTMMMMTVNHGCWDQELKTQDLLETKTITSSTWQLPLEDPVWY